ncbi:phage tail protein [Chryseobacterium sp. S-02]|uniref:phage tail protein n=1 Tax=Chryseobacterium sp. S-02 TaxID=3404064 RepID=UPI003CEC64DE
MKTATPVEKDSNAHQSQSRKQRQQEPVVPLSEVEMTNRKTRNSGNSKGIDGSANPNQFNLNNDVMVVHGSQTIYDQGSQVMYKKHRESLTQTGDINHPDTKETEKNYLTTLNTNQAQNYNDLKSGTYLPKTMEEQAMVHQQSKKIEETNPSVKPADKKDTPIKSDAKQSQAVNPDKVEADEIEKVSPNANNNPEFTALSGKISNTAKSQKQHEASSKASNDAQAAAPSPSNERQSMAQASQVNTMDEQKAGMFSKKDFKAQLTEKIEGITLPENEEQADEFEKHNNIDEVNRKAVGDVKKEKNIASNDIASATSAQPNTAAQPTRTVAKMPTPNIGKAPGIPNAAKAMPVKRTVESIEQPIKEQTASIDNEMQANGVTDNMLAKSNEPTFTDALAQKNKVKTQSVEATQQFRDKENKELDKTRNDAQVKAASHISGMHDARKGGLGNVHGEQKQTSGKDSQKRKEIADHINSIYQSSKTDVNSILNSLDKTVADKFARGSVDAKKAFEFHVDEGMKAYKKKRYGDAYAKYGVLGLAGKWVKDQLVGLPPEVNKYFVSGKALYIKTMDKYIDDIAGHVTTQLNAAKLRIAKGKKDVQTYVNSLSPSLRKIGKDAIAEIQSKFNALEESVNNKKDALIDVLAKKYADNIASIDTRIADLKAQNSGLVNQVLDVLKNSVFAIIIEIKNTLTNLLSGVISAIQAIIMDPIGFFKNLIAGVSQGFTNFGANIWTHLKTGFFGWLTGAMKGISLTMPEDVFSLKGIFSITTQVLGLTWGGIRAIGARVIGEPVMKVLETGSEKGLEVVQVVRKDGAAGLWEYLKDQFADLKTTVMDTIMDIVQTQVIQAGIKWVMGLLTPVGAFIKAAMAIIDVVKFFIQRAAQIMELVKAFTDSIKAIASGNVGAVAKSIENALGRAVPVLIGFLASLLGIGGLADKVLGVIRKIRQRIENAIVKFWNFVKGKAKGLLGKFMGKSKKDNTHEPEKQKKIDAGFIYLKEEEKKVDDNHNNKLTLEQAAIAAKKTKAKYPVFSSLRAESKDDKIIYRYTASPENIHETGTELENTEKKSLLVVGEHPVVGEGRQSHHVPENKFMERVQEFYGHNGKNLKKVEDSKKVKHFEDIGDKLLQREEDIKANFKDGNNLSAILLYEKTHIHSTIAVHSRELQKDVTENIETKATEDKELIFMGYDASKKTKRAQMSFKHWDNFIKDVYLFLKNKNINVKNFVEENENSFVIKSSGNKDGALNVISEDINKQIQELFDNFAEGTVSRSQLVRQKVEILEQINNTAMKSYENALAVGLQTVATALSKSDKDGDKSEHPKALDKLESLARRIWENHIVKKINL